MKAKMIKIYSLLLDLDNSRFPETAESQREAIIKMVALQGERIVSLARDIVDNGLDPSENIIVYKDSNNKHVVKEGNRRLTVLKLLNQPDIIPASTITNKIKKLSLLNPDIPDSLSCVVFNKEEDCERWVNLKHTGANGGAGRVQWTGQEVDRHKAKHGNTSFGYQLLTYIGKENKIPAAIKTNSQKLYITNINRLLADPDIRQSLYLEATNGILYCYQEKESFFKSIIKILTCMLESDEKGKVQFTVDRIRNKKDRETFLAELDIARSEEELELDKPWKLTSPETHSSSKVDTKKNKEPKNNNVNTDDKEPSNKEKKDSKEKIKLRKKVKKSVNANPNRNLLVPASVVLSIVDKKSNGVFKEIKNKLKHDEQPHSIAVMFRVFLELSLSYYLNENKIKLDGRKDGLHDKVVAVSHALKEEGKISGSQCTAVQVTSNEISKRAGALQQYVHNNHMFPDRMSLNTNWDNLEPLFVGIWS